MSRNILSLLFIFTALVFFSQTLRGEPVRCYDFSGNPQFKKQWLVRGKQFGIPLTRFYIANSPDARDGKALVVEANSSSGVLIAKIPPEVWQKYPVMRWRWRILRTVKFDKKELDDQAAVVYFGDGSALKQFMMAYSWEHFTAPGTVTPLRYGMGTRTISRRCMRNKNAEIGKWYVEERNVVEDFQKAFKRPPKNICGVTVGANSQYSKSKTLLEIDYIEFCKAPKTATSPVHPHRSIAERKKEK